MKLTETPTRSRFLALYLPNAYQWPLIVAMLALGLAMLCVGMSFGQRAPHPEAGLSSSP